MKNKGFSELSTGMCCECENGIGEIARGIACKLMKYKEKARWHGICYARISIINIFRYYVLIYILLLTLLRRLFNDSPPNPPTNVGVYNICKKPRSQ